MRADSTNLPYRFISSKTYGHDIGLSCAFRQWRATSHCRLIHGYALAIRIEFEAHELDERGWVIDFGALDSLKSRLVGTFDHKTLVAADDPSLARFHEMAELDLLDLIVVPAVGCERFAEMIFEMSSRWLEESDHTPRCWVNLVEVREHGANSAIVKGQHLDAKSE